MRPKGNMIRVRSLEKEYRSGKVRVPALQGVDFEVGAGEFAAVVGPSGCGKSTLLHVVGGMLRATRGVVDVDGFDVTRAGDGALTTLPSHHRRLRVPEIQSPRVAERARQPEACRRDRRPGKGNGTIESLLETVGIAAKRNMKPFELSQGEQQRVAIARALVKEPRLLLADEPTGNLDSENSRTIMALFRRIAEERGQTILMITHNEAYAALTDRVIQMKDGRTIGVLRPPGAGHPDPAPNQAETRA